LSKKFKLFKLLKEFRISIKKKTIVCNILFLHHLQQMFIYNCVFMFKINKDFHVNQRTYVQNMAWSPYVIHKKKFINVLEQKTNTISSSTTSFLQHIEHLFTFTHIKLFSFQINTEYKNVNNKILFYFKIYLFLVYLCNKKNKFCKILCLTNIKT